MKNDDFVHFKKNFFESIIRIIIVVTVNVLMKVPYFMKEVIINKVIVTNLQTIYGQTVHLKKIGQNSIEPPPPVSSSYGLLVHFLIIEVIDEEHC